ncbi:MAG: cation transporter [Microbacteriaceae bacterium]
MTGNHTHDHETHGHDHQHGHPHTYPHGGVRALKISLFVLLGTTAMQFLLVLATGSVALLADTIHDFSDALTAVPSRTRSLGC